MSTPTCRFCHAPLEHTFADLGMSPLANAFLLASQLRLMEPHYPLHVYVCGSCFLVQLEEFESPAKIFSDYAYFSSYSDTWLAHCRDYTAAIVERLGLQGEHQVVEIASNDGYLLQYFKQRGIRVLGVEPAENVARAAQAAGIDTTVAFFGRDTAGRLADAGTAADLLIANNVLAHVPDINDFVAGMSRLLKPDGVVTIEFPHLLELMRHNQFDTIYHEHFSYLSFSTVARILEAHGLRVFDVLQLETHGGSLRVFACLRTSARHALTAHPQALLQEERDAGLDRLDTYAAFADQVRATKRSLLAFLIKAKSEGKTIVGYGAPAKGNTLLNYCGIRSDFLDYTVDRSPHKQGRFLPGTHLPVHDPQRIFETRPDYVLILPWNLRAEIVEQMAGIRSWGGRFLVPVPTLEVLA